MKGEAVIFAPAQTILELDYFKNNKRKSVTNLRLIWQLD